MKIIGGLFATLYALVAMTIGVGTSVGILYLLYCACVIASRHVGA